METLKPAFKYNNNGVKSSSNMYRNIKGIHFAHYTSNLDDFDECKKEAKEKGLKVKIINGELYVEQK